MTIYALNNNLFEIVNPRNKITKATKWTLHFNQSIESNPSNRCALFLRFAGSIIGNGQCHYHRSHYLFMYPLPAHSYFVRDSRVFDVAKHSNRCQARFIYRRPAWRAHCHHPASLFQQHAGLGILYEDIVYTCLSIIRHTWRARVQGSPTPQTLSS